MPPSLPVIRKLILEVVVKQSMQSAVYDALEGQPDHFILDPHFHTVEHNFLVFKTAKTQVVGRKAKHDNYRQEKI